MPFCTDERIRNGKAFKTWSHINLLSEHVTEPEFQDRSSEFGATVLHQGAILLPRDVEWDV